MQIIRLVKTIRYLKFEQIFYQVKYRIIGYSKLKKKDMDKCKDFLSLVVPELDMTSSYIKRFMPEKLLNNTISFLNESFSWESGTWKNVKATHLWNFNFHYFEYAIALASKYKLTNDIKYFNKFKELYQDWWNSFKDREDGDAWHPYTISLRIPNILICCELFAELLEKTPQFKTELLNSIYLQYCFLSKNPEKNLLGNHYFENLKCLYICSVFFQEEEKCKKYEEILLKEIDVQILKDGMHYERSFMYHHIILEDLIRVERTSQYTDNVRFREKIIDTICKMADCIYSMEHIGTDRIPLFNDAGSGVAKSGKQLLSAVHRLYLYEPQQIDTLEAAGYYLLNQNEIKIVFDCGEMGPSYITGHGHCDVLSFELFADGHPIFVNGGTYQYQSELRSFFRSTCAHNTIRVGKNEQADCWGEHRTADRFKILEVIRNNNESVRGCVRYFNGDVVRREIKLIGERVIIQDGLIEINNKRDTVSSYFRIHPSCRCEINRANNSIQIYTPTQMFRLFVNKKSADLVIHADDDICWYSEKFGEIEKTYVLEVKWKKHINDVIYILERGK